MKKIIILLGCVISICNAQAKTVAAWAQSDSIPDLVFEKIRTKFKQGVAPSDLQLSFGRNQTYVLQYFGEEISTPFDIETIDLKEELRAQLGVELPNDVSLKKIQLFAKSYRGRGRGTLEVGSDKFFAKVVPGHRYSYYDDYDYHPIEFEYTGHDSHGKWSIKLSNDYIKVWDIEITVEQARAYTLRFDDEHSHFWGDIDLRQELANQHNLDTYHYIPEKVLLVAKSKGYSGGVEVRLKISELYSEMKLFKPVSDKEFQEEGNYSQAIFHNTDRSTSDLNGSWLIKMANGGLKIKEITIFLKELN